MQLAGLLLVIPTALSAQKPAGHWHIGLAYHDNGITIGNAARTNGLRLNFEDIDLDRVNGINVTIWKAAEPMSGTVNGLALGIVGPGAAELNGIAVGIGGVVASRRARWLTVGGLGVVSNDKLEGVAIAGLGTVANGDLTGLAIGGLGTVANRNLGGVAISGLGTVANRNLSGIAVALLGTVANRDITGIALAGLGTVANRDITGVAVGGLATVANGDSRGVSIGGLASVSNGSLTGLGIGGLAVVADGDLRGAGFTVGTLSASRVQGLGTALYLKTYELRGFSVAAYNRVRGPQIGLTVGIYNSARVLKGVQLGVVNRAQNNHGIFKILPLVNAHF